MYLRRWTKMKFHDALHYYKKSYHSQDAFANPLLQVKPVDYIKGFPSTRGPEVEMTNRLIRELFKRYPELKYVAITPNPKEQQQESIITKFVRKQMKFMKDGYSIEKAFDLTESLYQQQMQRRIDSQLVAQELAATNNARSFMNVYQQQVEYESRLKMQRAVRDRIIKNIEEQPPAEEAYDYEQVNDDLISKYEKTLFKIVPAGQEESNEPVDSNELCADLVQRTRNLFDAYYAQASVKDRLHGLTDLEITKSLAASPKAIKTQVDKILKKLDKYGIHLNEDRDLVIPDNTPRNVVELAQTPEFTAALMSRDIGYEEKHKQHLDTIEKKLIVLRNKYKQQLSLKDGEIDGVLKLLDNTAVDLPRESTYKLFENQNERLIRLEIKWWERRLKQLELQYLEQQLESNPDESRVQAVQERVESTHKRLTDLVHNLRYIKFKVEQANVRETSQVLFHEHSALVSKRGNFLNSGALYIDDVATYFKEPVDKRRMTKMASLNEDTITRLISRKPIEQGVHRLGEASPGTFINEKDISDGSQELAEQRRAIIEREGLRNMRRRTRVIEQDPDDPKNEPDEFADQGKDMQEFLKERKAQRLEEEKLKAATLQQKEAELSKNKNLRRKKK